MTFKEFRNGLCILRSIDRWELEDADILQISTPATPERAANWIEQRWMDFKDDPYDFLLRADDATTEKLWALMVKRGMKGHGNEL